MTQAFAHNIADITSSPSFVDESKVPPRKTRDELIAHIHASLQCSSRKTESLKFEKMLANVPAGFELVPTLYTRIPLHQKENLMDEFRLHVRPRFLQYLADQHADDLRAIGICDHGISRMAQGLEAADAAGNIYSVNIDHVIERAGCGEWHREKTQDPQSTGRHLTSRVNHFSNLMLLPRSVHAFKNDLNDMQGVISSAPGQPYWVLMLVRDKHAPGKGLVCPPQSASRYMTAIYPPSLQVLFDRLDRLMQSTLVRIDSLLNDPAVNNTLPSIISVTAHTGRSVASTVLREKEKGAGDTGIAAAFGRAVAYNSKRAAREIDRLLRPALREIGENLERINTATWSQADRLKFRNVFLSNETSALRRHIRDLPLEEAAILSRICTQIEIKNRYAREKPRAHQQHAFKKY